MVLDEHIKIGCKIQTFDDWYNAKNTLYMSHKEFLEWEDNKDWLFDMIKCCRKWTPPTT